MKAIVLTKYGSTESLQLREVEKPTPKANEVLIKIHASSINSWDWDLLRGKPFIVRLGGILKPKYKILGADISGRVEALGKNVKDFQLGDEVFGDISGCSWGGFAEYVCAHENVLALKPAAMTFEDAAAFPQAGVLALQGLRYKRMIHKEQKVLINGAGGGVGTFAIQIAKSFGAEVTGVDTTMKLEKLRAIGADYVIDYTQEDFTKNGKRYDLVLDVVGDRSVFDLQRALNPDGIYAMVGGTTSRILQVLFFAPWFSLIGKKRMGLLIHRPNRKDLDFIKTLFESGKVAPVIDRYYPLSKLPDALRYYGEGQVNGKLVIL